MEEKELEKWFIRLDERQSAVINRLDKIDNRLDRYEQKQDEIDNIAREAHHIAHATQDENKQAKRIAWSSIAGVIISLITGGK